MRDSPTNTEQQTPTENTQKKVPGATRLWIGIGCVGIVLIIAILFLTNIIRLGVSAGPITITEVVMTTGLDSQGRPLSNQSRFPPDQPRILCYISISSPAPARIGIRWYHEDELLLDKINEVSGNAVSYIQPRPGHLFQEGEYRVEIYFVKEAVKTINFSVVK